jgi:hypothetical protein
MRAGLIWINWVLSLFAVGSIETEGSSLWAVVVLAAWFFGSSFLLKVADRRGWMAGFEKRFKWD